MGTKCGHGQKNVSNYRPQIYAIQDKVNLIQNVLTRNKSKGHDVVKGVAIINTPVIISLSAKNDNFWKVVTQQFRKVNAVIIDVAITPNDL